MMRRRAYGISWTDDGPTVFEAQRLARIEEIRAHLAADAERLAGFEAEVAGFRAQEAHLVDRYRAETGAGWSPALQDLGALAMALQHRIRHWHPASAREPGQPSGWQILLVCLVMVAIAAILVLAGRSLR